MAQLSILSAVRNEEKHIVAMIESVLAQDLEDWELVIVDDCSTDDTARIARGFADMDDRIVVLDNNMTPGKVAAFNRAFSASSGDYIVLLAGDDIIPENSGSVRVNSMLDANAGCAVGYFRLVTMSDQSKYDGMIVPRSETKGNRSGGTMIATRALAEIMFPVDETLISEDIWLGEVALAVASEVIERPDIVLHYRIHDGNSNPRQRPFREMSEAMHVRHLAWQKLASAKRLPLSDSSREALAARWEAEELRYTGRVVSLLITSRVPLIERAAMASMAAPALYALRSRFYRLFSGRR